MTQMIEMEKIVVVKRSLRFDRWAPRPYRKQGPRGLTQLIGVLILELFDVQSPGSVIAFLSFI